MIYVILPTNCNYFLEIYEPMRCIYYPLFQWCALLYSHSSRTEKSFETKGKTGLNWVKMWCVAQNRAHLQNFTLQWKIWTSLLNNSVWFFVKKIYFLKIAFLLGCKTITQIWHKQILLSLIHWIPYPLCLSLKTSFYRSLISSSHRTNCLTYCQYHACNYVQYLRTE